MDRPSHEPEGHAALLRRHHLSPRHRRLHDPGRRSARPGHRRAGLQICRRVPSEPAPQQARHPVDGQRAGRTPTAASSSSRSGRHRTSTTSTRCSARSRAAWTSCARSGAPRSAPRDRPLKDVVIKSVTDRKTLTNSNVPTSNFQLGRTCPLVLFAIGSWDLGVGS